MDYADLCACIYRRLCPFLECCFNACGVLFTSIERNLVQIPAQFKVLSLCIPSSIESPSPSISTQSSSSPANCVCFHYRLHPGLYHHSCQPHGQAHRWWASQKVLCSGRGSHSHTHTLTVEHFWKQRDLVCLYLYNTACMPSRGCLSKGFVHKEAQSETWGFLYCPEASSCSCLFPYSCIRHRFKWI